MNGPGSRIRTESGAGRRRLISLTPLIDVVFILLVFFMLSASAPQWDSILLGSAVRASDTPSSAPALWITLDPDSAITLDRQSVPTDDLARRLTSALVMNPGRPVVVQPARGVPLEEVVSLLQTLSVVPTPSISLMRSAEEGQ